MKIIAKVKFNNEFAYVLDQDIELKYVELKDGSFVGFDESKTFYNYYGHYSYSGGGAFGGREFTLDMLDGTIKKIKDYWWDGLTETIKKYFRDNDIEFISITVESKPSLMDCYVFCGMSANKEGFEKLLNEYTGKTYEYNELRTSYYAAQLEKTAIKFKNYDGSYFEVHCKLVKKEDLYRKIKSRNLKAKKLNRMEIYNVIFEPWGNGNVSRSSPNLIKFTDDDVKNIKEGLNYGKKINRII